MSDVFDSVFGQPHVRDYLRASVRSGRVSHAYLFTGPAGSNKTTAAYALASAILCKEGGCGTCETCRRIERRKHPDARFYAPEGAGGYLVEQVREIVADTSLAPIQADRKVYILDRVDLLGVQAANAFLKTLEEPPADVTRSGPSDYRLTLPSGAVQAHSRVRGSWHSRAEHRRHP